MSWVSMSSLSMTATLSPRERANSASARAAVDLPAAGMPQCTITEPATAQGAHLAWALVLSP